MLPFVVCAALVQNQRPLSFHCFIPFLSWERRSHAGMQGSWWWIILPGSKRGHGLLRQEEETSLSCTMTWLERVLPCQTMSFMVGVVNKKHLVWASGQVPDDCCESLLMVAFFPPFLFRWFVVRPTSMLVSTFLLSCEAPMLLVWKQQEQNTTVSNLSFTAFQMKTVK